jgi:hypothetical protein
VVADLAQPLDADGASVEVGRSHTGRRTPARSAWNVPSAVIGPLSPYPPAAVVRPVTCVVVAPDDIEVSADVPTSSGRDVPTAETVDETPERLQQRLRPRGGRVADDDRLGPAAGSPATAVL